MANTSAPSARPRWLVPALAGCGLIAACVCVAAAAAGGYAYFRTPRGSTSVPTIEYVLDASPRMESPSSSGEPRLVVARGVLADIVRTADPGLTAGLRVFGTGAQPQGCEDTDLVVPLASSNHTTIQSTLAGVEASRDSDAPVAQAMIEAIQDLASTEGPHSIVVVTGGADACNPEAAELVRQEADRAGIDLRMFVVGFEVPPDEVEAVKAFVDLIPGATYTNAAEATQLRQVLSEIQTEVDAMVPERIPPVIGARTGETACDHPYLPLRSGATWSYDSTEGAFHWAVTSASGSAASAEATMTIASGFGSFTYHWFCTTEGIVSYDFGSVELEGFGDVASINVTDSSGVWLPPAESMVPGASWSNEYTTTFSISAEGVATDWSASTSETWTVAGTETISTPAGTFEALRIDGSTNTAVTAFMGIEIPATTTSQTYWLAEGVGVVRYTSSGEGFTNTGTLTSYSVP